MRETMDVTGLLMTSVIFLLGLATLTTPTPTFDTAFRRFLKDHDYSGGSVAALKDGRLILARSYGVTGEGTEVKVGSRFPVSSLSKSLTAVGVLRLVQEGLLDLEDKVFGRTGILKRVKPLGKGRADPRLGDITVGHLLRHSAGWNHTMGPLLDPVLNEVYLSQGQAVPSIARAMDVPTPLEPLSIIRYSISRPLHYAPGTKTVYSNLGYLVLGRVIEEASSMMYEDFIKKRVLNPCGMWHTRLGNPPSFTFAHNLDEDVAPEDTPVEERRSDQLGLFEMLDPASVDSTLGWYSTVFDMARFSRCVFDGDKVLNDATLELLLQQGKASGEEDAGDASYCAGFVTNQRGVVWQDGDPHADDVILYHDLLGEQHGARAMPDTWVLLLHGNHLHHLRHRSRDLMKELASEVKRKASINHFVNELSDVNAGAVRDEVLVKLSVEEHHLDAYVSAVQQEGYSVVWVTPLVHKHRTSFLLISRLVLASSPAQEHFTLEHGLGEKQLLSRKLQMERRDFNLTFLQSYRSQSHRDDYSYLAVFRKEAYTADTQLKYGTEHLPEPYDKLVQMYQEKRFYPLVQSVQPSPDHKEERFSFLFIQTLHSRPIDFKTVHRVGESKLQRAILLNSENNRSLSFLDAYQLQGRTRFAAVFSNQSKPRWDFRNNLSQEQVKEAVEVELSKGLWPAIIVPFAPKNQDVRYAVFFRSDEDHAGTPSQRAPRFHSQTFPKDDREEEDQ